MYRAEAGAPPSERRAIGGREGFTLIEVLVAFLILVMVGLAVQRGVMTAVRSSSDAQTRIQAEMVARTMLSAPLGQGVDALRPQSGMMNGMRWTIRLDPVTLPFPTLVAQDGNPPAWRLFRMLVSVSERGAAGGTVNVEILRLVRVS